MILDSPLRIADCRYVRKTPDRKGAWFMFMKSGWVVIFLVTALMAGALLAGCPPCSNRLELHNGTIFPITAVYVRMQGSNDWGNNEIGSNIWPAETDEVTHLFPGCYEVRIVYPGFDEEQNICILCQETYTMDAGD
jgi:hypothetical protein